MSFLRLFKQGPMCPSGKRALRLQHSGLAECGRIICALPSTSLRLAFPNFMESEPNASSH
jgi:hypothetical protein